MAATTSARDRLWPEDTQWVKPWPLLKTGNASDTETSRQKAAADWGRVLGGVGPAIGGVAINCSSDHRSHPGVDARIDLAPVLLATMATQWGFREAAHRSVARRWARRRACASTQTISADIQSRLQPAWREGGVTTADDGVISRLR